MSYYLKALFPKSTREKILCLLFFISASTLVVTIFQSNDANFNAWETLGISFGASGVATSLIEIINVASIKLEISRDKNIFSILFSYKFNGPESKSYSLVLPSFTVSYVENKIQENEEEKSKNVLINELTRQDLSQAATQASVGADIIGASNLTAIFSRFGFDTPKIEWDKDLASPSKSVRNRRRLLAIGIFSNVLSMKLNEEFIDDKYKKFFNLDRYEIKEDLISEQCEKTTNLPEEFKNVAVSEIEFTYFNDRIEMEKQVVQVKWDKINREIILEGNNTDSIDYGLLARICDGEGRYIICGAVTEKGTELLTEYITVYWSYIYKRLCEKKEILFERKGARLQDEDSYTVIFKIPVGRDYKKIDNIRIINECIDPRRNKYRSRRR